MKIDREEIRFDGVKIVLSDPEEGWVNIKGWKTFFSARLGSPVQKIKAVLFDYGGVLAEEGFKEGLFELAKRQGLDPQRIARMGRAIMYSSGYIINQGTERGFWQIMRLRTNLRGGDRELSDTILNRFRLRPGMLEFVRLLRAKGFITAIVSDQTDWLERLDERDGFFREFDHVFNSYRLGKSKRDPSLFDDVAQVLGIEPEEALFTDDTPGHVARAKERGMHVIIYEDENQFRSKAEFFLKI